MKGNTQKWFDGEVLEKLNSRDFIRNLKNLDSKLIESYLTKRNMKTWTDRNKKAGFFKEKISESIGKPKELWEALKYLNKTYAK